MISLDTTPIAFIKLANSNATKQYPRIVIYLGKHLSYLSIVVKSQYHFQNLLRVISTGDSFLAGPDGSGIDPRIELS